MVRLYCFYITLGSLLLNCTFIKSSKYPCPHTFASLFVFESNLAISVGICHPEIKTSTACYPLHAGFLLGLFFNAEDEDMFIRNTGWFSTDYVTLHPRR
jgi:hypothetical protein